MKYITQCRKITGQRELQAAFESTSNTQLKDISLAKAYRWRHSPIRTQLFEIVMRVPTYVSVHFVRHKVGVEHFVQSNRSDRGGDKEATRHTLVNHLMFINAESLMNMAQKRLCGKADPITREVMEEIVTSVGVVDPDLANSMVPTCVYRGGICPEPNGCERNK